MKAMWNSRLKTMHPSSNTNLESSSEKLIDQEPAPSGINARKLILSKLSGIITGFSIGFVCWLVVLVLGLTPGADFSSYSNFIPAGIVGAILGGTRFRFINYIAVSMLALLLLIVGFTPVVRQPALALIAKDPLEKADAVVVLSAGITRDNHLGTIALDRLLTGLDLIRNGFSGTLVVTQIASNGNAAEADQDRLISLLPGHPEVHRVGIVLTTHDEGLQVKALADKMHWKKIILVTSPLHSTRAKAVFEKVGLKVISQPCVYRRYSVEDFEDPSGRKRFRWRALDHPYDKITVFSDLLYETMAAKSYRRKGWIN